MSELLFKLMAGSYSRHHQQTHFLEDCLSAIDARTTSLRKKLTSEIIQIQEALSDGPPSHDMSVIEEEDTERSLSEPRATSFEDWMEVMRGKSNYQASKIQAMEEEVDKLVGIYKSELLEMSKEMTKWEEKNQDLKSTLKACSQ